MKNTEKKEKTILVFDAETQAEVAHTIDIDGAGEIVLTNPENGRFLKFPRGTTAEELKALLEKHKEANIGQVSQASIDEHKEKLLEDLLGKDEEVA